MLILAASSHDPGRIVLYELKFPDNLIRKAIEQAIATVQLRCVFLTNKYLFNTWCFPVSIFFCFSLIVQLIPTLTIIIISLNIWK